MFINKTLGPNNLEIGTVTYAEISVFATCVKANIYMLLYNLHDSIFKLFHATLQYFRIFFEILTL